MSSLFIVESPGKVEKIQHILDDLYPHEFVVRASVGHVCDLPNHEIGFSYPAFVPKYEISQNKTRVVQELRQVAKMQIRFSSQLTWTVKVKPLHIT